MTHVTVTEARPDRPITSRQRAILAHIVDRVDRHGAPPTIREIGEAVGIDSTSVVNYHLDKLADRGLIVRGGRISRGLIVTAAGRVEAGAPEEVAAVPEVLVAAEAVVAAAERLVDRPTGSGLGARLDTLERAVASLRLARNGQPGGLSAEAMSA